MASTLLKSQFCFLLFIVLIFSTKAQNEFLSYEELKLDVFHLMSDDLGPYDNLEDDTGPNDICLRPVGDQAHCVWYGKCVNDNTTKTVPCADNCLARPVSPDSKKWNMLSKFCGDFFMNDADDHPAVCCSLRTLAMLNVQLTSYEGLLNRCPSCWYNYRKFYCTLNCAPDQSKYMIVRETADGHFKSFPKPPPKTTTPVTSTATTASTSTSTATTASTSTSTATTASTSTSTATTASTSTSTASTASTVTTTPQRS